MSKEQILIDAIKDVQLSAKDVRHEGILISYTSYNGLITALSQYKSSPSEDELKDIDTEINNTMFMKGGNTEVEKDFYTMGAKFGYSLSIKEIERLKDESVFLKSEIGRLGGFIYIKK